MEALAAVFTSLTASTAATAGIAAATAGATAAASAGASGLLSSTLFTIGQTAYTPMMLFKDLGTVSSMIGSITGAQSEAAAMEYNADVQAEEARAQAYSANMEANKLEAQGRRLMGEQATRYAASGVDVGAGSPLSIMEDTAAQIDRDAWAIRFGGDTAYRVGMAQKKIGYTQAKNKRSSGWWRAGSSLLAGLN